MKGKQTARIISTYTADTMGVASALFELGGMTVMHDASGCNSTYNTHDEPRWYDTDSMVYISALTEMEAMMGDDEKLIGDIVSAARELSPKFIAIAGTPIPMLTGTDLSAVASVIEKRTGIPSFGFATDGMHSYISGVSMAFTALAERLCKRDVGKTSTLSVNLLGLTPLDWSVNGSSISMRKFFEKNGVRVVSTWAMGSSLEEIENAGKAFVNVVVSFSGYSAALRLRELFGTPFVVGAPIGAFAGLLLDAVRQSAKSGKSCVPFPGKTGSEGAVIIGESVYARSLAAARALSGESYPDIVCPVDTEASLLSEGDVCAVDEDDIIAAIKDARSVTADPLYRPICPKGAVFEPLPHEAFSGRLFRKDIPDMICADTGQHQE